MNGLPGMVGSGMPETYELYQLLTYVKEVVDKYDRSFIVPTELSDMVNEVNAALDDLKASDFVEPESPSFDVPDELFTYWDTVATAREKYRAKVEYYFSGNTTELNAAAVSAIVGRWLSEIEIGMARALKFGSRGDGDDGYVFLEFIFSYSSDFVI